MKVAIVSDWFSEAMGYGENCLPKALASWGVEVHLITANLQPYFSSPMYKEIYEPFIGPAIVACGVKQLDGYTLHRLPHRRLSRRQICIPGLAAWLDDQRPAIVQTFDAGSWTTYQTVHAQQRLGFKLFLESHLHASVYPGTNWRAWLQGLWQQYLCAPTLGRWVNRASEKCYPISSDAAEITTRYFGIQPDKIRVTSLGVDTDLFKPVTDGAANQQRLETRRRLGFKPADIVCIYTGRFTSSKDPFCLAEAVAALAAKGLPFRGLFVGSGVPEQVAAIQHCSDCVVHPFVSFRDLPPYYQAADIGVWPRQESTSQLDAVATGLPIIISDRTTVTERIAGNGLTYREGDRADLARALLCLADESQRRTLGAAGAEKILREYSWRRIAQQRLADYQSALQLQA